jgi:hypothetical protein
MDLMRNKVINAQVNIGLALVITIILIAIVNACSAQLVVKEKNISEDKDINYIQLIYYVEKKTFKPVYLIDYGLQSVDSVDFNPEIKVNGETIAELTPVAVLNKLYTAGWEYLGDYIYINGGGLPMHTLTLKRRDPLELAKNQESTH